MSSDQREGTIRLLISRIGILSAIDDIPSPEELNVLIDSALKYYSAFTPNEILTAFELNMVGEYPETVKHFGLMNFKYFSEVMTQYRKRKASAWIEFNTLKSDKLKLEAPQKATPEQSFLMMKKEYLETGEVPKFGDFFGAFDYMWDYKLCDPIQFMKEFFEKESQIIKANLSAKLSTAVYRIEKQLLETQMSEDNIKAAVRELYVRKRIPELCQQESMQQNSEDLLKKAV